MLLLLNLLALAAAGTSAAPLPAVHTGVVVGRVTRVAPLARNLFVLEGDRVVFLELSPSTEIVRDGRPVTLERLPIGSRVRVSFDLEDDEMIARRVEVVWSPPKASN